jgi:hypothetical protein
MAVEGVLGTSEHFDITMQPSPTAMMLYNSLRADFRMVLVTTQEDWTKVEHWLRSHWLVGYSQVLTGIPEALDTFTVRAAQLRSLKASRTAIDLYVDIDGC